jgi:L-fuconate dehydratase
MTPAEIAARIDFRYISDALTPDEAIDFWRDRRRARTNERRSSWRRISRIYDISRLDRSIDEKIRHLCREAIADRWTHFKVKVGASVEDDRARVGLVRQEIGPGNKLMIDANQRWDVNEAIERVRALSDFDLLWIEEPTSPDDVWVMRQSGRGVRPIGVATGERAEPHHLQAALQAEAIDFCQIDSCRLGGVNENLAVILMAHKFGVPVCPHAGGVGLCELVQHLSMFDYLRVSARMDDRVTEFVDHLHEHFVDPCVIRRARYMAPHAAGIAARSNGSPESSRVSRRACLRERR